MNASAHAPLSFKHALLAMLGISLVLMLSALDQTVIGNALPSIVAELDGFELYAWVATETALSRKVRRVLLDTHGLNEEFVKAAGYWRLDSSTED